MTAPAPRPRSRMTHQERRIADARQRFCEVRRDPDHLIRWMAWLSLRAAVEGWPEPATSVFVIQTLMMEAEAWKRGFRPPATLHEAMARGRRQQRSGRMRIPGETG